MKSKVLHIVVLFVLLIPTRTTAIGQGRVKNSSPLRGTPNKDKTIMKNKQYIPSLYFTAFLFLMTSSYVNAQETSQSP